MRKALIMFTVVAACSTAFGVRSASAANILGGTNGNDLINGSAARDILFGKGGNDLIRGFGGDDLMFGGGGQDRLVGGAGNDTLVDDDGTGGDVLNGGPGFDTLYSLDGGNDTLNCGADGGVAFADPGDTVRGCSKVIRRSGITYRGRFVFVGGNGNTIVNQPRNAVYLFGRNGNDTLRGSRDDDIIFGGGGNDIMQGFKGNDVIVDDDSANNEAIQTGGDDGDVVYAADGAKGSIDCSDSRGRSVDTLVFADSSDTVFNCGGAIRV